MRAPTVVDEIVADVTSRINEVAKIFKSHEIITEIVVLDELLSGRETMC